MEQHLPVGDPLVSGSLKNLFYEYVQTEDKAIPGRESGRHKGLLEGIMEASNPCPKWEDVRVKIAYTRHCFLTAILVKDLVVTKAEITMVILSSLSKVLFRTTLLYRVDIPKAHENAPFSPFLKSTIRKQRPLRICCY